MQYTANPVVVTAYSIRAITTDSLGNVTLSFQPDDSNLHREKSYTSKEWAAMISRYDPLPGDYLVIQGDGYEYLNPADVFQRKYSPINHQPAKEEKAV